MAMHAVYYLNVNIGNEIFFVDADGELTKRIDDALRFIDLDEAQDEAGRWEALGHHVEMNTSFRMVHRLH